MRADARIAAVTLIELLVVIGIIAMMAGIMVATLKPDRDRANLNRAAIELRNTIRQARSLAMSEGKVYAITFNLGTQGDGRVLRNFAPGDAKDFPGRHWYSLIRPLDPKYAGQYNAWLDVPPMARQIRGTYLNGGSENKRLQFMEIVREHQVGARRYLPKGVRFLALSDYDGGAAHPDRKRWDESGGAWGRNSPDRIYPVPWFGSLVDQGGDFELFGWGFFDNAAARKGPSRSGSSVGVHSAFGANVGYPHFRDGDEFTIVEGDMMDAYLVFHPDGRITWEHSYRNKYVINGGWQGSWWGTYTRDWSSGHHITQTGGFHLTLCRDVDDNEDIYLGGDLRRFANERDALQSILPLVRIFAHAESGVVEVRQGPTKAPKAVNWVEADGTAHSHGEMGSGWWGVHPACWIQQHQALYSGRDGDEEDQRAYHDPDNPFARFKPARTW